MGKIFSHYAREKKKAGKKSRLVFFFFNHCIYMLSQLCLAKQSSSLNSSLLYVQFTYPWPTQLLSFCMHWPIHSGQYFHKSVQALLLRFNCPTCMSVTKSQELPYGKDKNLSNLDNETWNIFGSSDSRGQCSFFFLSVSQSSSSPR